MPCSKIIATEQQLEEIVSRLAGEISSDLLHPDHCLAIVALEGAQTFATDLLEKLDCSIETKYIKAASYRQTHSTGKVTIQKDNMLIQKICGRDILLIDDIYDTGLTLCELLKWIDSCQPKSIRTCVLLEKQIEHIQNIRIDYLGMKVEDNFVVGYGLDFDGQFRNLPYLGILSEEILSRYNVSDNF